MGVNLQSISLLEAGEPITDDFPVGEMQSLIVLLSYASYLLERFEEEFSLRRAVHDRHHEHFRRLIRESDEARVVYEKELEKHRAAVDRVRGRMLRRREQFALTRKADLAEQRSRNKMKSALRVCHLESKIRRLSIEKEKH